MITASVRSSALCAYVSVYRAKDICDTISGC